MQRAMIVDAICAEPAVLIADNVTQPLDVTIAAQIVALLHDLCVRLKMATIYLSSSLPTLGQFGNWTAVLHGGRLIEAQAFPDLIANPKTDYTRKAIASVPRIWSTAEGPAVRRSSEGEAPLMRVDHVHRTYKARKRGTFNTFSNIQAVRGVTLDIMPRENFGVVGESGCGKSTLTRLLAWLERPDRGAIVMNGVSLGDLPTRQLIAKRNQFQLLLQDPYNALPPRTTVGRMIEESLRIRGETPAKELRARVTAAMAEVGLPANLYDELPNALSTGERQRISIARALILDPKLLILDETLTALDQREQAKLIELFSRLQEKNDLTYVFISHDFAMVRKVCTRIAVMYLGEMVEIADNRELFFAPQHPYTKALLSAAPTLEEKPLEAKRLPSRRRTAEPDRHSARLLFRVALPARLRAMPDRNPGAAGALAGSARGLPSPGSGTRQVRRRLISPRLLRRAAGYARGSSGQSISNSRMSSSAFATCSTPRSSQR